MDIAVNKLNTYGVRAWSLALFFVGRQADLRAGEGQRYSRHR